jgi:hypothetical protein
MLSDSHTNHLAGFMKTIGGGIYFVSLKKSQNQVFAVYTAFASFLILCFFIFLGSDISGVEFCRSVLYYNDCN